MNGDLEQRFPGLRRPASDFRAVRSELQTGVLMHELDLSVARSIAAGTAAVLKIAGNSIYVDKNTDVGSATLIFQDDSNLRPARVFAQPGFIARVPWTLLTVENTAQTGKTLRFFYGVDIDFQPGTSNEITGNIGLLQTTASTPQGSDQIVATDHAWIAGADTAGGAGTIGKDQIKNPAASGKVIYVDQITFRHNGAAGAFFGLRHSNADLLINSAAIGNKNLGGPAPTAQFRWEATAGGPGTLLAQVFVQLNQTLPFALNPPIRLEAGEGLVIAPNLLNATISNTYEGREY